MATLHERVALVTGAGRGIGAAEAVRLAQAGARVAVLDLSEDHCWETAQRVRDVGADALAVACDVARPDEVTRAITQVVEHFGRLDILVNNAGILRDNLLFRMSDDEWDVRRLGQPQDIANVVAFFVSDEASYINGETIYVAGGPVGVL